jgi:hypothetical protein
MVIKTDWAKSEGVMPNRPASSRFRALLKFIIIGRRVVSANQAFAPFLVKPGKSGLVALGFAPFA